MHHSAGVLHNLCNDVEFIYLLYCETFPALEQGLVEEVNLSESDTWANNSHPSEIFHDSPPQNMLIHLT